MSPDQIQLVRQSFARVAPIADQAATLFYARLFALDPAISRLFSGSDMPAQGHRLMEMIGDAVRLLEQPAQLDAALRELGKRHVAYGVQDGHYATVGAALLATLADALGPDFTPATRAAWGALYAHVGDTMQAGAQEVF